MQYHSQDKLKQIN